MTKPFDWIASAAGRLAAAAARPPALDAWRGTATREAWCRAMILADLRERGATPRPPEHRGAAGDAEAPRLSKAA